MPALLKLDGRANIVQTVIVGTSPAFPVFDGANIWVPNYGDNSITVVQASTGVGDRPDKAGGHRSRLALPQDR